MDKVPSHSGHGLSPAPEGTLWSRWEGPEAQDEAEALCK